jgi:hypothetical protein
MTAPRTRSKVSNGSSLFADSMIDERGTWARRLRDLMSDYVTALGGADIVSPQEFSIIRCAAAEKVELELIERRWALKGNGAKPDDLDLYARVSNSLRRHLESIGLRRVAREINPPSTLDEIARDIEAEDAANNSAADAGVE